MVRTRHWCFALALALLLGQLASLAHALEHQLDGPAMQVCLSCAAAEMTALVSAPPALAAPLTFCPTLRPSRSAALIVAPGDGAAQPRAPPHSR